MVDRPLTRGELAAVLRMLARYVETLPDDPGIEPRAPRAPKRGAAEVSEVTAERAARVLRRRGVRP